jgi:predicted metal-dependent HD superfamily phosphohydrolase
MLAANKIRKILKASSFDMIESSSNFNESCILIRKGQESYVSFICLFLYIMEDVILNEAEAYIRALFEEESREGLSYHDIVHTEYVARQARLIGQHSGLDQEELKIVVLAAWFHDSGFVIRSANHEDESQSMVREFLTVKGVTDDVIKKVVACIEATRMPQDPGDNLLAKVLCDADMAYLSEDFYIKRTNLLRKEWNHGSEAKLSRKDYYKETIELFENHHYFTSYGKANFSEGKAKNLQLLHSLLNEKKKKKKRKAAPHKAEKKNPERKKEKDKIPGRGVESMFRLTARNQINLSSIADNKANILISINTLVLTVLISIGIGKISDYPVITIPAVFFVSTCLITIIFAILSTRPKISSGKFSKEDIHYKRINLLFFGNFYNMKMDEYEWAVKEMMEDQDYLYTSMIRDQYSLGKVIANKYRLLRIAYTIFMIGLIISSLLFAVFILFVPQ